MLASALKRLGLYEEAFGFTRLRLSPRTRRCCGSARCSCWCSSRAAAPRGCRAPSVAVTGAAVLLFALADPERRIAEHNLERYERTGKIDLDYLRLARPGCRARAHALPGQEAACVREELRRELDDDGVAGFNLARAGAPATRSSRSGAPRHERVLSAEQQLQRVAVLGVPARDPRRRRRRAC